MCVSVFSAIESTGNPGNLIYIIHVIYILLVGVIMFLVSPCQIEVSLPPLVDLIGVFMFTIVHLSTVFVWYPHGIHPNSAHHLLAKLRPTTATTAL